MSLCECRINLSGKKKRLDDYCTLQASLLVKRSDTLSEQLMCSKHLTLAKRAGIVSWYRQAHKEEKR